MTYIQLKKYLIAFFCLYITFSVNAQELEIENLGKAVNSAYSELNPIISADGKTLYFIRANSPDNSKKLPETQDVWISSMNEKSEWLTAIHAGNFLNRSQFNTLFNVSTDGNKMLIGGSYLDGVFWGVGFSFIERNGNSWSEPHYLNIKNFEKMCKGEYSSACLLSDNKTLILSFSEKEESKVNDMYVSFYQKNGKWTEPKLLGTSMNTEFDETTPFMAADGITLYFASDRPGGFGSKDIYVSKRLDDSWQKWSTPINMGKAINTEDAEGYYTIPASGNFAYMVSHQHTAGKSDIVRIKTKEATKPKPVVLLSGKVLNAKTQEPIEAEISYEVLPSGIEAGTSNFLTKNGDYKIVLPYGKNYGISAKAKGYIPVSINVDLTTQGEYTEMRKALILVPIEAGQIVRLNNIFFDSGKSILKTESYPELERLIKVMKENSGMNIQVVGHTDDIGEVDANLKLSIDRAMSVEKYLIEKGIKISRVISTGFGESKPIATNETEEGKQQNRRVEFKILKN